MKFRGQEVVGLNLGLDHYSFQGLVLIDDMTGIIPFSQLTAVRYLVDGYVGKQPVAWKEYSVEYRLILSQTRPGFRVSAVQVF